MTTMIRENEARGLRLVAHLDFSRLVGHFFLHRGRGPDQVSVRMGCGIVIDGELWEPIWWFWGAP